MRRKVSRFARRGADGLYPDVQPLDGALRVMRDAPPAPEIPEIARYDARPAR